MAGLVNITTSPLARLTDASRMLLTQFSPEQVTKTAALRVKRLFVNHFTFFNRTHPNQIGGRRTNMVADFARATSIQEGRESSVSVTHTAILQKIYGGPIVPRLKRYLTLPAIAEAYGRPSRDFPSPAGLKFAYVDMDNLDEYEGTPDYIPDGLKGRSTKVKALVENDYTQLSRDYFKKSGRAKQVFEKAARRGGRIIYWLVRKVVQRPTEGIIPDRAAIDFEIFAAVDQLFREKFSLSATSIEGPFQPGRAN